MSPSRSVHCRAAAAGATIIALIKTTPDGLQPDHDRDHHQRRQGNIEPTHRHAEAGREVRIEAEELDLFPDQHQRQEGDDPDGRHCLNILDHKRCGLAEEKPVQPCLGSIRLPLDHRQQNEPETEEDREHERQRSVVCEPGRANDAHHRERADPAGDRGPDQQDQRRLAVGQHEGEDDAGKRRMGHRIPDQALPPQDSEHPQGAAHDPEHGRTQRHRPQRVIENEIVQQVSHASREPSDVRSEQGAKASSRGLLPQTRGAETSSVVGDPLL